MRLSRAWPRVFAFLLAATFVRGSVAQTLYLSPSGPPSPIRHGYQVNGEGTDGQSFTLPTPTISLHDYNAIEVTTRAPTGFAWLVHADPVVTSKGLSLGLNYGFSSSPPYAPISSFGVSFDFVNGASALGAAVGGASIGATPYAYSEAFGYSESFQVVGDVEFTGYSVAVQYDNSALSNAPIAAFYYSDLQFNYFSPSDPGQRLTLVPIPEPTALMLSPLGLCVALASRRARWA